MTGATVSGRVPLPRSTTRADVLRWLAAGSVVLAVHAGAAVLAASLHDEKAGNEGPSPAVMIELAPAPEPSPEPTPEPVAEVEKPTESMAQPQPLPTPPQVQEPEPAAAPEVAEALPEPSPPPETKPETPTEPIAEAPPQPDPLEQQMLAALEEVEVPLPMARPAPPAPAEALSPRPERKPAKTAAVARKADAPKTEAAPPRPVATRKASAPASAASASASAAGAASWKTRLAAHLERRKRYPSTARARGEQGTALVVFRIDEGGRVLSASLSRSSGSPALDEAALAMVNRASPVPAPPPGVSRTVTAPVRFVRK